MNAYALFETSIGTCAIAWGPRGITAIQLPEIDDTATVKRIRSLVPQAVQSPPSPEIATAIAKIVALLNDGVTDLSDIALDLSDVPPFHRKVYESIREIPPGKTLSYGEVATEIGQPGAARAVGQALGRNPFAIVVPCHRVLAAGAKKRHTIGGFSAPGGLATKRKMLEIEGLRGL